MILNNNIKYFTLYINSVQPICICFCPFFQLYHFKFTMPRNATGKYIQILPRGGNTSTRSLFAAETAAQGKNNLWSNQKKDVITNVLPAVIDQAMSIIRKVRLICGIRHQTGEGSTTGGIHGDITTYGHDLLEPLVCKNLAMSVVAWAIAVARTDRAAIGDFKIAQCTFS